MIHLSTVDRRGMLNVASVALNGGALELRTGAQEATPESAASGTLLISFPLPATFQASASTGADGFAQTLTAAAIPSANVTATGFAAHFRLLTSGGRCVMIGDVSTSGSDVNLTATSLVAGTAETITSMSLPFPF